MRASTPSCILVAEFSFDVTSEFDPAELTNALDQARREVSTRYDFKDTQTTYERRDQLILIDSGSEERAKAALQVLREKAARRQLSPKLFKADDPKTVGKGRGQIEVHLNAGITDELARDLRKRIQNVTPKVQVRIQGDQLRVVGKDKDTLQLVINANDIMNGQSVRLVQGDFDQRTVYSDDPATIALDFARAGATRLHVVDLDAARGEHDNRGVIERVIEAGLTVQV